MNELLVTVSDFRDTAHPSLENLSSSKLFQSSRNEKPESEMIRILQKEAADDFEIQRKKSSFRFTGEQVKFITGMLDKHGNDYKVSQMFFMLEVIATNEKVNAARIHLYF